MKKGLIFLAIALIGNCSFGQTVHKGVVVGLHISNPDLKEGVTMEAYTKFFTSKVIPAYDKAFPGMKTYLIKSLRGVDSSSVGVIFMFNNETDRNKYFNTDGSMTKLGNAASEKLNAVSKEMDKYVTSSPALDKYNDWLVE
jgi:hypothetical protein